MAIVGKERTWLAWGSIFVAGPTFAYTDKGVLHSWAYIIHSTGVESVGPG
jgi:hypothetical protein